jgi:hypothetical protein
MTGMWLLRPFTASSAIGSRAPIPDPPVLVLGTGDAQPDATQAKSPRQPIAGVRKAPRTEADHDPDRYERRDEAADKAAPRRRHKFLNQWKIDAVEPTDNEPDEKTKHRQKDPPLVRGKR